MQDITIRKTLIGIAGGVGLSFISLYFLLRYYGQNLDIIKILASLPIRYIVLLFLILLVAWLADAYRLCQLAGAFGRPLSLRMGFTAVLAGNFSINITPFFMGAGLIHIYVLHRKGLELGNATAAVAGGAMISHFVQALLALASLLLTSKWHIGGSSIPGSGALLILLLTYLSILISVGFVVYYIEEPMQVLRFFGRWKWADGLAMKFRNFHLGLHILIKNDKWRLLRILMLTSIYLICIYAIIPVILAGLGSPQPLGQVVAFQLLLFFAASLAPTPGSSGAFEFGAFSLFARIVPIEVLAIFLVWWRIATFYSNLVTGVIPFIYLIVSKKWYGDTASKNRG